MNNTQAPSSLAEEIALDTLSVFHLSEEHTAQFYILKANKSALYENFLYVAEPMEDPDKIIGAGIISISTQYNHGILSLLFPVGMTLLIPLFHFSEET